ncbi:uncharacterized protein LOC134727433 [Mytilus trossulus]|uniref:uncharacterized protein LOC134727433 n=1 Tax=Mytilus trossulus TaxID=6551 RepID=UPI0030054A8C
MGDHPTRLFSWIIKTSSLMCIFLSSIYIFLYRNSIHLYIGSDISLDFSTQKYIGSDITSFSLGELGDLKEVNQYNSTTNVSIKSYDGFNENNQSAKQDSWKFLVDSENCKIPDLDPFDAKIKDLLILHPEPYKCDDNDFITYIQNNTLFLNLMKKARKRVSYCRFKPIYFNSITGKSSEPFIYFIDIEDEFLKVECFDHSRDLVVENFHINFKQKIPKLYVADDRIPLDKGNNKNDTESTKINMHHSRRKSFADKKMDFAITDRLNIMLIMIDSTSRINSLRYFTNTRRYLTETLGAVEMLGYNKLADNTMVNMVPLLTGEFAKNLTCLKSHQGVDNCSFIWQKYSQNGYLTHFGEDMTFAGTFHYTLNGFKEQPTDYYDRPFYYHNEKSSDGVADTCFHGKSSSESLYQRMYDLAYNLRNQRYFSLNIHSRNTHTYLEGLADMDNLTLDTISKLYENNLLNNTFMAIFGDHGLRFGEVRQTFIGQLEERLPMMFLYLPEWFKNKYSNHMTNLKTNSRRLTTHFDMFYTLLDLLNLDKKGPVKRGISLFREIPRDRTCEDAYIDQHWCTCNYHLTVMDNDTVKNTLSNILIKHLNSLLEDYDRETKCSNLTLVSVISSVAVTSKSGKDKGHRIVIKTEPGNGVFEATLRYQSSSGLFHVKGDVSRLSKYGDSSKCVTGKTLRKICFCI